MAYYAQTETSNPNIEAFNRAVDELGLQGKILDEDKLAQFCIEGRQPDPKKIVVAHRKKAQTSVDSHVLESAI